MLRFCPIAAFLIIFFSLISTRMLVAAVTVTPASGLCLNNSPGAYTAIGSIIILEGNNADFAVQTGATLILTAPAGFEFLAGTGSVSYRAGRNISAATIAVTLTTITVTYTCGGNNKTDRLTINGIQARGTIAGSGGNIFRTGGTATIAGDASGGGVDHGNLTSDGTGILVNSIANGNWSSSATWSTGVVPSCGQDIIINHVVTLDVTSTNPNLTITDGGNLIANNAITVTGTFSIPGTGIYTHNNTTNASTTIFAGTESFSSTSSLVMNQWYNLNIPLGSLVSSTFGDITFNVTGTWQQDGYFAPARILGNITIEAGKVIMDDGTGMSTSLTLQDVTINGTANLTVCMGTNRNFALVTNNFTDNGTDGTSTIIMNSCTGILSWTANGNVTLNDNFNLESGSGSPASVTMYVAGNFNITGGSIELLNSTNAPFTLTVVGSTQISGSPSVVSFVNSGSGAFVYNTSDLEISSSGTIAFLSGSFSGTNQFTISNDLNITGSGAIVYMVNISGYSEQLNLTTGRDTLVKDGDFYVANSNGTVDINCGRNMIISGASSLVNGQFKTASTQQVQILVNGTFNITTATLYITKGEGSVILTVGEAFVIDNGYFFGIVHTTGPAAPTADYTFQDFTFLGGTATFFNVKTSSNTTVTVNCSNNFDITWESNSDFVELVSYDGNNDASLILSIGGNFTINGNYPNAYFLSSKAGGDETVDITGSFSVSGGLVFFVCDNTSTSGVDAHNIITNIGGNIIISGGETYLSARDGSATVNVTGDVEISSGTLNLKWLNGIALLSVNGNYTQTGGTFNIHSHTGATTDTCKVIIDGDFSQTAGTFNFDNRVGTSMAEHTLTLNGANYTIGGSAIITHANNLSNNYIFGQIYFNRTGTTVYSRNSSTHNIQHVKQTIRPQTIVNASASSNGFQMTSVASSTTTIHNSLTVDGTLDMGNTVLTARQQSNYYSQLSVNSGGRYRTSHTGGLYSGTSGVPSSIDGFIIALNRVNYDLNANSIVEYYGSATSIVTGVPNGIATGAAQQYGILDINFTGTAGSTWIYPETSDEVTVRTSLILSEGEFNLDSDHATATGGRAINIENGATISRTSGFIRSETEDGSGLVRWNITANGSYVIPFGFDATEYIPYTYQQTSGSSGIVSVGTYRSLADNTPYPPTVTHVRDVNGIDNSVSTVDRFWYLSVPGSATSNLTFSYTNSEGSAIVSPRAQLWEPVSQGWFPPAGVQSNPTGNTTLATGITGFNNWWTLSAAASPLPVELIYFSAMKKDNYVALNWATATEIDNSHFTIERSTVSNNFEAIGYVQGAGNSTSTINYSYHDKNPLIGTSYYRLKQTDYDGKISYSEIKAVQFNSKNEFSVFPNPVNTNELLNIIVPSDGTYDITVTDSKGNEIYRETQTVETNKIFISMSYPQGMYFLQLTGPNSYLTQKIVVK